MPVAPVYHCRHPSGAVFRKKKKEGIVSNFVEAFLTGSQSLTLVGVLAGDLAGLDLPRPGSGRLPAKGQGVAVGAVGLEDH